MKMQIYFKKIKNFFSHILKYFKSKVKKAILLFLKIVKRNNFYIYFVIILL